MDSILRNVQLGLDKHRFLREHARPCASSLLMFSPNVT